MTSWSRESVLRFIELYRSIECLWKVKSKDYCNRLLRERGYNELVRFCQAIDPEANKEFVVKKISNLRNAFRKHAKKYDSSRLPGADPAEAYEPKLWYFHSMMFLKDQDANLPEDNYNYSMTPVPRMGFVNEDLHSTNSVDGKSNVSCASQQDSLLDMEVPFSPQAESEGSIESEAISEIEHKVNLDAISMPALHSSQSDSPADQNQSESQCPNQYQSIDNNSINLNHSPPPSSSSLITPLHEKEINSRRGLKRNLVENGEPSSSSPFSSSYKSAHLSNNINSNNYERLERPDTSTSNTINRPYYRTNSMYRRLKNRNHHLSPALNPHPKPNPAPSAGDWYEALGKNIGDKLRILPWDQRIHAEKLILDVMYEAELGSLSRQTTLMSTGSGSTTTTTRFNNTHNHNGNNNNINIDETRTSEHQGSNYNDNSCNNSDSNN